MGFSAATFGAAKGITTAYTSGNKLSKAPVEAKNPHRDVKPGAASGWAGLLQDDDGIADLSKIQLLFWTFLGIFFFLGSVKTNFSSNNLQLPDIDPSLMALMGLGQAAYLGKKLVTRDTPRLTSISTARVLLQKDPTLTLSGGGFGDGSGGQINFKGQVLVSKADPWSDAQIKLKDIQAPVGAAPPITGPITVMVGGAESNGLNVELVPSPWITNLSTSSLKVGRGASLTIQGRSFGSAGGQVRFDGQPVAGKVTWKDTQIDVEDLTGLSLGTVKVTVVVDEQVSNEVALEIVSAR
jgi:IPT/TIG domain-containing protein